MILTINPKNPQSRLIRNVVEILKGGGLIGYPTDTIYGVGCDLFNQDAIRKIQSPWATSMRDASRSSGRMMQALG